MRPTCCEYCTLLYVGIDEVIQPGRRACRIGKRDQVEDRLRVGIEAVGGNDVAGERAGGGTDRWSGVEVRGS